jgi:hypothetical protein
MIADAVIIVDIISIVAFGLAVRCGSGHCNLGTGRCLPILVAAVGLGSLVRHQPGQLFENERLVFEGGASNEVDPGGQST